MSVTCSACGHDNSERAKFCEECGTPVSRGLAGADPQRLAARRAPADRTPRHLAEKILRSKGAMEGERKQLTVLFADVKGSMELAEELDPEQWHRILDRFFQILTDGVHRFEGTVNQYTGDGIMALFGAPIAHEDHAQRACYAALGLREQVADYATEVKREFGVGFSMRMGIHSGEVVVGKIGDDLRMDYTAQGHTVGLAQRMESLASPDTCYLSDTTAGLVAGYFELESLGEFRVKGVSSPVRVHRLVGPGQARSRFDVSRARGLTRFVGRDADLETLENALREARQGHGRVVGVVADAGVGKSRLCFEFAERCRAAGMTVNVGQAVSHGRNVPLLPMLQVFRAYFDLQEGENDRRARDKIAGRLLLIDESFRKALPVLFEFFGVADPALPPLRMDPDAKHQQIFSVLRHIVQGADPRARADTFLTLIEDLHWMDPASEAFLEQWVEAIAGSPSFLLVNFRPEYRAAWMQQPCFRALPLAPLGPEAVGELLRDLLGDDPSTAGLGDAIHARTGGNPFYAEEVVQSLIESGQLEGERGAYRLLTPVERIEVPASVQALLASRIDRLAERDKQVLQVAAVIGREFSEPILHAASDLPETELRAALSALEAGGFVFQQALYPESEYAFKHPLTQEVALSSQLQEKRRATHAAVARAVESAHPDKLDERAALLAHHWEAAGEPLVAARWHTRAGAWHQRNDPDQAQRHLRRVLDLTAEGASSTERDELRLEACRALLANGGWRLGASEVDPEAIYTEGRQIAERLGRRTALESLTSGYAAIVGFGGDVGRYVRVNQDLLARFDDETDPEAAGLVHVNLAYGALLQGRMRDAIAYIERIPALVGDDSRAGIAAGGMGVAVWHYMGLGENRMILGELEQARALLLRAIERSGEIEIETACWAHAALAEVADHAGALPHSPAADEGRRHALEAMRLAERTGGTFLRVYAARGLGVAHLTCGAARDAREVLETALELARAQRSGLEREAHLMAQLSRALLACGEPTAAREMADRAVSRASEQGTRFFLCLAELARARALRGEGAGAHEIAASIRRARALVAEIEARVLEPQVVEEEAWLAEFEGDDASAVHKLRRARDLYARIGARGHRQRLDAELRG